MGIEFQHRAESPGDRLPWGGPKIREQTLPHGAVGARDLAPVALNHAAIIRLETLKKGLHLSGWDLLAIADRIDQQQTRHPFRMLAGIRERYTSPHAVAHQHEAGDIEDVDRCPKIGRHRSQRVLAILRW